MIFNFGTQNTYQSIDISPPHSLEHILLDAESASPQGD